jgi:hypothetical protein
MVFNTDRRKNRDRRVAERKVASGHVKLTFENPASSTIDAELVESSATGFRAVHDSLALEPGLEVAFQRPGRAGRARLIWTHVQEGRRVSGFVCLP